MKLTRLLLLMTMVSVTAQAGSVAILVPPDLTVLEQDQWGITLELELPSYRLETVEGPEGPCRRILVDGWARTAAVGLPELPLLGCTIRLPGSGGISADILEADFRHHTIQRLFPVPPLAAESDEWAGGPGHRVDEPRPLSEIYPAALVEVGSPAVRRGRRQVRVLFQPFQWDPADGRLRCATRLRVRLAFEQPISATEGQGIPAPVVGERGGPRGLPGYTVGPRLCGALRIEVDEDGLYAMDYGEAMAAAGIDHELVEDLDPATFKLFNQGLEVPLIVAGPGQEAPWPGGNLFFYGQGIDSRFTGTNVYWLYWDGAPGSRMETIDGTPSGGGALVPWSTETVRSEENHRLWEATPGAPDEDYWFWDLLTAPTAKSCQLEIHNPAPGLWEATLRICFQGRSTASPHPNHHTRILLNGVEVGSQFWDGDQVFVQEIDVPPGVLASGLNTVDIDCPGDTGAVVDSVYLNWIEVEYRRRLRAVDDRILMTVQGSGPLNLGIHDFTSPMVAVFDISDPCAVKRVLDVGLTGGGPFTVLFGDKVYGTSRYLALTPDRFRQPVSVEAWTSPGLRGSGNGADYILITPRDFLKAVGPLVLFRQGQGLRAMAVAVEDIHNEFSHGLPDPAALKAFLAHAYQEWTPPAPAFVLLLGDANTDYLDHFGTGKQSLVPVHLSQTDLGLTPDDNWYVAVEGDDVLPEMCIGRLPSADAAMAGRLVQRLLAHEQSAAAAPAHALFVADDELVFENLNETLIAALPKGIPPDRVYLSDYAVTEEATADIVRAINRGEMIVHYNGHGSVTSWAGEGLFDTADTALLTNDDDLTFVLTMTCLNGYFSQPFYYCLAEALATAELGGGIGCFSPSGLSYTWEQDILAPHIFSLIFDEGEDRLGVIVTEAKLAAHSQGVTDQLVSMFTLLGDPASRLKPWE